MMDREKLQNAVDSKWVPVYATSYEQVKDALQDKYGQRGWIGKLAQAVAGRQEGVKAKDDKPYQAARRSIERYEKGQFKDMRKYSGQMEKVGKQLPPIGQVLPSQFTVTVSGIQHEKGGPRDRSWSVTFKGKDRYDFATSPSYYDFFDALGYPDDIIDSFDGDDSSGVEVTYVA